MAAALARVLSLCGVQAAPSTPVAMCVMFSHVAQLAIFVGAMRLLYGLEWKDRCESQAPGAAVRM